MNRFTAWARQPSTIIALAVAAGAAAYALTSDPKYALAAFLAVAGGVSDHTVEIAKAQSDLAQVERITDALRSASKPPGA